LKLLEFFCSAVAFREEEDIVT